jgi:hypothetical protein
MLQIVKRRRVWLALAIAAVLIAGHGVVLYYVSSHLAASTAVFAGVFRSRRAQALGTTRTFLCDATEVAQQTMTMTSGRYRGTEFCPNFVRLACFLRLSTTSVSVEEDSHWREGDTGGANRHSAEPSCARE